MAEFRSLQSVLQGLSEESVFSLLTVVQRRARKQALAVKAGRDGADLKALQNLQEALVTVHQEKLQED